MRHPKLDSLVPAAALALAVAACGPDIPPTKPLSLQQDAPKDDVAAIAAEESTAVTYVYSPVGKRDPFHDPVSGAGKVAVGPRDPQAPREPLQKHDIDQLTLKFTVVGTSTPSAMIVDRNGKGHMVRVGSWVGKNWGKVSHIGREEITITETIADQQTGRVYPQYIPMRMPKSEAEMRLEEAIENPGAPL